MIYNACLNESATSYAPPPSGGSMQINQYHSKDCKSALCSWKLKIKRDLESQDNALEMLLRGNISTQPSRHQKTLLKVKDLFELQMARFFSCRILRAPGNLHHTCPLLLIISSDPSNWRSPRTQLSRKRKKERAKIEF